MFLIFSKLSSILVDPVGLTLLVFAIGLLLFVLRRKKKIAVTFLMCGFSLLLIFSSPLVSHFLMRGLEKQYLPSPRYRPASAVVLLGGTTTGKIPPRIHIETAREGNRIFNAARVFRQSGSPYLVLTGGIVDIISEDTTPEAHTMFELLNEMFGISADVVIIEDKSRNTRENAVYTKAKMEEAGLGLDIILVTSAYHMPRSVGIFKKAGFTVTPAPSGYFKNDFISAKPLTWLPSSAALFDTSIALREYVGIIVYKIMGWI
ncbi:MAG: YdcF family protein [Chitinispirillales bacterium]|jgi:uncharacterized SAM-binding protein YcdF (DUF218 family)|nr:YdcF family protein [Chitinispirillales bacterium]